MMAIFKLYSCSVHLPVVVWSGLCWWHLPSYVLFCVGSSRSSRCFGWWAEPLAIAFIIVHFRELYWTDETVSTALWCML